MLSTAQPEKSARRRQDVESPERSSVRVRDYADRQGVTADEALKRGMSEKAVEFVEKGGEIYHRT